MNLPSVLQKQIDMSTLAQVMASCYGQTEPILIPIVVTAWRHYAQRVRYALDIVLWVLLLLAFYAVTLTQADDKHAKLQKASLHWCPVSRTYIHQWNILYCGRRDGCVGSVCVRALYFEAHGWTIYLPKWYQIYMRHIRNMIWYVTNTDKQ